MIKQQQFQINKFRVIIRVNHSSRSRYFSNTQNRHH